MAQEMERSIDERLSHLEGTMGEMKGQIEVLIANQANFQTIIKYVVVPLIIIVGALTGIKLALP